MHAPPNNLDYAKKCASIGLAVFPCGTDKKALVKWRAASTTDAQQIAEWWRKWPNALPAIELAKSGHVVIDGDRHGGPDGVAAVEKLFAEHSLNTAAVPTVVTPSDGRHYWFKQRDGKPLGNSDKAVRADGINVRGQSGYVIAPGASLPDGRRYRQDKATVSLFAALRNNTVPVLPPWFVEILRPKAKPAVAAPAPRVNSHRHSGTRHQRYASAALDRLCGELAATPEGSRNTVLNNAALSMGHMICSGWIERGGVEQRLTAAATAAGLAHDEIIATINSGINAGLKEPHAELEDRPQQQHGSKARKPGASADPAAQQEKPGPEIDLAAIFSFLGDAPAAPPRELIKNHLPAYGVAITGGQSGAGKTFISIHKAVCLATAIPYFGYKIVERVGTAYVAAEGRALIINRFAAALAKHSITDKLPIAWIKRLPDFGSPEGIKLFIRQMKALDERFRGDFGLRLGHITIDTVAATFAMKDEDDNSEATRVCNVMRTVGEETETLVGVVHHYGKNPESGLRGASAWKGSADVIEGVLADIDPLTGKASKRELVRAKARDGEHGPVSAFELEFVELGLDEDNEIYGSCCLVPAPGVSRFDKTPAANKGQRAIQNAINEVLDSIGQIIVPRAGGPSVKAVKVIDVRKEFDRFYVVDEADPANAAAAKRMAYRRAMDRLPLSQFGSGSAEGADWIWKIK